MTIYDFPYPLPGFDLHHVHALANQPSSGSHDPWDRGGSVSLWKHLRTSIPITFPSLSKITSKHYLAFVWNMRCPSNPVESNFFSTFSIHLPCCSLQFPSFQFSILLLVAVWGIPAGGLSRFSLKVSIPWKLAVHLFWKLVYGQNKLSSANQTMAIHNFRWWVLIRKTSIDGAFPEDLPTFQQVTGYTVLAKKKNGYEYTSK